MRTFIVIGLILALGIGIAGFAFGWFNFSTSSNDGKSHITLTVDQEKLKKDRDKALAVFHTSRDEFQKQAEIQLKGMDRSLDELKVKAKTASAESKDQLNQAIKDLGNKTQAVRQELKELGTATQEGYDTRKTHLDAAMEELKVGLDKAGSRIE
jgi:hypothetical protein